MKRALAVLAGVVALLGLTTTAAQAHVQVDGQDATRGGYGVLTFRVPAESATASTTKLVVAFPTVTPIASVSTQPIAGWTATVTTARPAKPIDTDDGPVDRYVATVTWTADDMRSAIHPGQFQEFSVAAGPLPTTPTLTLPATQTYSDGTVVRWNERSADGAAEPEHPAPVLALAPADATTAGKAATPPTRPVAAAGDPDEASWPGWTGVGLGVVAVLIAGAAFVRAGRRRVGS